MQTGDLVHRFIEVFFKYDELFESILIRPILTSQLFEHPAVFQTNSLNRQQFFLGAFDSKSFEFGLVKISPTRCFPSNFVCKKKAKSYGHVCCKHDVLARAEYNGRSRRESGGGDFLAGFLLGGVVFGALGFLFAPQISKTLWSGDEDGLRKKLPRRMDDDEGLEKTRKTLNEKIAQLNSAIDDVSAQLRAADGASDSAPGASEVESAA